MPFICAQPPISPAWPTLLVHIAQHIAEEAGFLALFGKLCPASSMLDSIPANNNHDLCMNISAINSCKRKATSPFSSPDRVDTQTARR
jgi:hypothetical protein